MGVRDDDGDSPVEELFSESEDTGQRGVETDSSRYFETGRLALGVAPDGLPVVVGPQPSGPEPGLSDDNLVCLGASGREPCRYLGQILVPADGEAKGFAPLRQIRRFCTRLATASELWELTGDVFACTLRVPHDAQSSALINDFEARQKQLARDAAQKSEKLDL